MRTQKPPIPPFRNSQHPSPSLETYSHDERSCQRNGPRIREGDGARHRKVETQGERKGSGGVRRERETEKFPNCLLPSLVEGGVVGKGE